VCRKNFGRTVVFKKEITVLFVNYLLFAKCISREFTNVVSCTYANNMKSDIKGFGKVMSDVN
jgi:hypothetical protein